MWIGERPHMGNSDPKGKTITVFASDTEYQALRRDADERDLPLGQLLRSPDGEDDIEAIVAKWRKRWVNVSRQ